MLPRFPTVLTNETFPQAWQYTAKKYVHSRKCHTAENLVERTGHFLFLLLLLFSVNGLLYARLPFPALREFYGKAPWFAELWQQFDRELLLPAAAKLPLDGLWAEILLCLLFSWLVSFGAACLLFSLILLLSRPETPAMPEDPQSLDGAQTLLNTARAAAAQRPRHPAASSASMFYLLAMIILFTLFLVPCLQDGSVFATVAPDDRMLCCIAAFGAMVCYGIANWPLAFALRLLCRCSIPPSAMEQMETYLNQLTKASQPEAPVQTAPFTDPDSLPRGFSKVCSPAWLSGFPEPITAETVSQAWRWADRKLRWAEKGKRMYQAASLVSAPLFAIGLTAFVFDLLCQLESPVIQLYLTKLSRVVSFWEGIRPMLYPAGSSYVQQGIAWATVLYLIPLALSAAAALAVGLAYHPKARHLDPTDPPAEQARQLCLILREAKSKSKPQKTNLAGLCNILFAALWGILAFGLVVFYLEDPVMNAVIQEHGTRIGLIVFVLFVGMSVAYRLIALPLTLPLYWFCSTWIPRSVLTLSEDWFSRCEEAALSHNCPTTTSKE